MAQVPPKPAGSGPMRPSLMTFRRLGGHYSSLTCISRDIIRARATEGHPCLTALRRPWLRADRHRLAPTSMSRKPATTLGCPPASRGPTARRGRERRRERAGHGSPASGRRFERSQGWRSEIKRAAPSGVSSCGGARNASRLPERQAGDRAGTSSKTAAWHRAWVASSRRTFACTPPLRPDLGAAGIG